MDNGTLVMRQCGPLLGFPISPFAVQKFHSFNSPPSTAHKMLRLLAFSEFTLVTPAVFS
jgi:hypothetical protein